MADHKLDIFAALAAVDRRDAGWLDRQPEDARRGLAPPVFLRWTSALKGDGLAGEFMLRAVNERVNVHAPDLMTAYPDLLFRLAASCGTGTRQDHQWLPMAGQRGKAGTAAACSLLERYHPQANRREIELLLRLHTPDSIAEFAADAGMTAAEIKEVVKSHGTLTNPAPKARPRKARR